MRMTTETNLMKAEAERIVASHPWWYHRYEIYPGVWTPGVYDPSGTYDMLKLPEDLSGMRILEIGPADGYFTKRMTAAGAHVTAVDYCDRDHHRFSVMEKLAGRQYDFHQANLYDIPKLNFQPFDIVLFLGVLYHLPDMVKAFATLRPLVKKRMFLDGQISRFAEDKPIAVYLPAASFNNDMTNFWAPNAACCEAMLKDCGFNVERTILNDDRGFFDTVVNPAPNADIKIKTAYSYLTR